MTKATVSQNTAQANPVHCPGPARVEDAKCGAHLAGVVGLPLFETAQLLRFYGYALP